MNLIIIQNKRGFIFILFSQIHQVLRCITKCSLLVKFLIQYWQSRIRREKITHKKVGQLQSNYYSTNKVTIQIAEDFGGKISQVITK